LVEGFTNPIYIFLGEHALSTKVKPIDQSLISTLRARISASPEAGAAIGFIAVFIFFAFSADNFLTPNAIASMLTKQSVLGIVAVGIAFLMISGEFDLSAGSVVAVAGIVFGQLLLSEVNVFLAMLAAVAAGAVMGLVNGVILVLTRIPSFIVTLGTLLAYRAIALTATGETGILRYSGDDPTVTFAPWVLILLGGGIGVIFAAFAVLFARSRWQKFTASEHPVDRIGHSIALGAGTICLAGFALIAFAAVIPLFSDMSTLITVSVFDILNGQIGFLTNTLGGNFRTATIWLILIVVIFSFILTQTRYGNAVFATGGNPGAARAQGISVDRVKVINFMLSGSLAALAAVMEFARQTSASGDRGTGWELEAIAAAVIGGSLLSGGYGSIVGVLIGVLLSGMLSTGMVLLGVPSYSFRGFIGVILVIAVVINNLARRQS
jgi:ribose/xylose/arabinose/galactoside ABC-type transport system permease subunit